MIKDIFLSVCDNCNTVSLAPEYTSCVNCGCIMVFSRFVRESVEQNLQSNLLGELKEESENVEGTTPI